MEIDENKSNKRKETMNIRLNAKLKKNLKRVITLVLAIAMIFTQNNIPGLNINMFPSASDGNVVTVNLHGYSGDENGKKIVINFTAAKSETISSTDTSTEPTIALVNTSGTNCTVATTPNSLSKKETNDTAKGTTTYSYSQTGAFTVTPDASGTFDSVSFTVDSTFDSYILNIDEATSNNCVDISPAKSVTIKGSGSGASFDVTSLTKTILELDWNDGNTETKPSLTLGMQYRAGTSGTWTNLNEASYALLCDKTLPSLPAKDSTSSASKYTYTFEGSSGLIQYAYDTDSNTVLPVTYRLVNSLSVTGYSSYYLSNSDIDSYGSVLVNTLLKPYEITLSWKDAGNKYSSRLTNLNTLVNNLTLKRSSDALTAVNLSTADSDKSAEGYIKYTNNESNNTWTITVPNAFAYDVNGDPLNYCMTQKDIDVTSGMYASDGTSYVPLYSNIDNFSSYTDGVYNGGTLTDTLSNSIVYSANMQWVDDGTDEAIVSVRPSADVTLLRYPMDGKSNYTKASPVTGKVTTSLDNKIKNNDSISIKLPTDSETLPEFNEDGYVYAYFTKEELTGGSNSYVKVLEKYR